MVKIHIKGAEWTIVFMAKRSYEKLHGEDSSAITIGDKKEIHFNKTDLCPKYVYHELGHAYFFECNTESANLDAYQTEEVFCSIIGDYLPEIQKQGYYILSKFME
jgi:hypothetical protein